jgi:hypothetical protein
MSIVISNEALDTTCGCGAYNPLGALYCHVCGSPCKNMKQPEKKTEKTRSIGCSLSGALDATRAALDQVYTIHNVCDPKVLKPEEAEELRKMSNRLLEISREVYKR